MIETEIVPMSAIASASGRLKEARAKEPNPLHPADGEVEAYVAALLEADNNIALALRRGGETMRASEREALQRKRGSISASIARQASMAGRRMGADRAGSIATLNAMFKMGVAPNPTLDGRYRGELISTTMFPLLDGFARSLARLWLPWKGKRFNSSAQVGDNVFTPSAHIIGRLFWPTFSDYRPYKPGLYTAFDFRTYNGQGIEDPELDTLKLDYNNPANPRFLIRAVVDEVVQLSDDYYLGKAFLKNGGGYKLAAFFALRRYE